MCVFEPSKSPRSPHARIGRKNHWGSRSELGNRVAGLFYSLIEWAKLAGVEPRAYFSQVARRVIRNPGTVTLPHDLK